MSRRIGVRKRALGLAVAAACAAGALALGFSGTAASASPVSVGATLTTHGLSSSAGNGSSVQINAGDSLIFSRGAVPSWVVDNEYTAKLDARSASGRYVTLTSAAPTYTVVFPRSGSFAFNWTFYDGLFPMTVTGQSTSATVFVTAPPSSLPPTSPPTSPADSPPGSSPGRSSLSAGPTGAAPGSVVNLVPAPSSVRGFAAPPPDTASGTGTSTGSHAPGTSPGRAGNTGSTDSTSGATPGPVSRTTLYADVAVKKTRPVGLAIICIIALAAVTGFAAYQRLGRSALSSARRR